MFCSCFTPTLRRGTQVQKQEALRLKSLDDETKVTSQVKVGQGLKQRSSEKQKKKQKTDKTGRRESTMWGACTEN